MSNTSNIFLLNFGACHTLIILVPHRALSPHDAAGDLSVSFPYLTELFSELIWRVVAGSLPVGHAVAYLRSDKPFERNLPGDTVGATRSDGGSAGTKVGEDEWRVDPIVECLCDTVWGVDSMVSSSVAGLRVLGEVVRPSGLVMRTSGRIARSLPSFADKTVGVFRTLLASRVAK